MLNINDLENRWLRYKIKSYIPYGIILITSIFVGIALYFFILDKPTNKDTQEKPVHLAHKKREKTTATVQKTLHKEATKQTPSNVNLQKEKKIAPPIKTTKTAMQKPLVTNPMKKEKQKHTLKPVLPNEKVIHKIIVKPSMNFLQSFKEEEKKDKSKPITKTSRKMAAIALPTEEYIQVKVKEKKREKKTQQKENLHRVKITIKRRESKNDIKRVISRFKQNNNPALSLFAAKKYYELGNYKQAYNYALVTNKINNDIEESWLIFAKALVKLGKKDQAIRTLQKYSNYSHSSNAQILLDEIQRGKFQ